MTILSTITDWLKEQWQLLTLKHLIYLMVFSIILSYVTEYLLKFKQIRWIYYTAFVILMIKLVEGDHPISAAETVYKFILI